MHPEEKKRRREELTIALHENEELVHFFEQAGWVVSFLCNSRLSVRRKEDQQTLSAAHTTRCVIFFDLEAHAQHGSAGGNGSAPRFVAPKDDTGHAGQPW